MTDDSVGTNPVETPPVETSQAVTISQEQLQQLIGNSQPATNLTVSGGSGSEVGEIIKDTEHFVAAINNPWAATVAVSIIFAICFVFYMRQVGKTGKNQEKNIKNIYDCLNGREDGKTPSQVLVGIESRINSVSKTTNTKINQILELLKK